MMPNDDGLKIITAEELMETQLIPQHQIVDEFLPAGTYILFGDPKIGKSFLVTQLCWNVSEGKPFLEHETQRADVLYLALEDTDVRLQGRLNRMFGVDWQGERLHLAFQSNWQGDELIQRLRDFVFEYPDTRLIVIDTLLRARANTSGNSSYADDYTDIQPFKEFADTYNLALVLVHHARKKKDGTNPFDWMSGTNGLHGAADGAFILYRDKGEILLDSTGRDFPPRRFVLRFSKSICQWELVRKDQHDFEEVPAPLLDWIDAIVLDFWKGTATQLLENLKEVSPELTWLPNQLTKKLNVLTARLEQEKGIRYRCSRNKERRLLTFERIPSEPK